MDKPPEYIYFSKSDRPWFNKIMFYFYHLNRMLMVSFYFYFMPFLALYLAHGSPINIISDEFGAGE